MAHPNPMIEVIDGFNFVRSFGRQNYFDLSNLEFQDNDVVVSTFPKCGTNWVAYIVYEILHRGEALPANFLKRFAFPDKNGVSSFVSQESPRLMYTHFPPNKLRLHRGAKFISVARNPFDCLVSFYEFTKTAIGNPEFKKSYTLDKIFQGFVAGETPYNDFFDHVKSWYELRNERNVCFLTYEDVKKDTKSSVLKLAAFLGDSHVQAIRSDRVMNKILEHVSFDCMKSRIEFGPPPALDAGKKGVKVGDEKLVLFRSGKVGGWRERLPKEDARKLMDKMETKLSGTELLPKWKAVYEDKRVY